MKSVAFTISGLFFCLILGCHPKSYSSISTKSTETSLGFATTNFSKNKAAAPRSFSKKNYKLKVAESVLNQLVNARGDFRMRAPKLEFSTEKRQAIVVKPSSATVILEEAVYDVCTTFGQDSLNALAALFAHELIHYYEKHDWTRHFARNHQELRTGISLGEHDESLKMEAQADYLGGFLAYSAGFQTLGIMPELLQRIYTTYDLNEELKGYPSLEERQKIAQKSYEKLKELQQVFDMGNYLIVLGEYETARQYFEFILRDFQSREIYNNLGVLTTLMALPLFEKEELPFAYPIELDAVSRLGNYQARGQLSNAANIELRTDLLLEALRFFEQAVLLDKSYQIAVQNQVVVYLLKDDLLESTYLINRELEKSKNEGNTALEANFQLLQGILFYKKKDIENAQKQFEMALKNGQKLAQLNLDILQEKPISTPPKNNVLFAKPEKIDSISLDLLVSELMQEGLPLDQSVRLHKAAQFGIKNYENSRLLVHFEPEKEHFVLVHLTNADYAGRTNFDLQLRDSLSAVATQYGQPTQQQKLTTGTYQIYKNKQLFFLLDAADLIKEWGVFRIAKQD